MLCKVCSRTTSTHRTWQPSVGQLEIEYAFYFINKLCYVISACSHFHFI